MDIFNNLEKLELQHKEISEKLADPKVIADIKKYQKYSKTFAELSEIVEKYRELKQAKKELKGTNELLQASNEDLEMREMARQERIVLEEKIEKLEKDIGLLLLPKDPNDEKNVILEIRAGTGGEEAALFAADLFRMYSRFVEYNNWKMEILSSNPTDVGGFKEIIALIEGKRVYSIMKYESGTHRVQRVPETEASGRIHTSAVTVAVLPEAEEVDVDIDPNSLKVDVFRSSGPGGQSVNTTDSAVRITHLPTGLVVSCQDEKSQLKNKNKAMKILRARLLDKARSEQQKKISQDRKSQVGTGDRSAKIRTYNFPQSRVTDHRINLTLYKLESILTGELNEITDALRAHYEAERLKEAIPDYNVEKNLIKNG